MKLAIQRPFFVHVLQAAFFLSLVAWAQELPAQRDPVLGNPVRGPSAPSVLYKRGDVNSDGSSDMTDAINILQFLFLGGERPACRKSADVNDDGAVDIGDPVALLNFLYSGGARPPEPFLSCGKDSTPDSLGCAFSLCGPPVPVSGTYDIIKNKIYPALKDAERDIFSALLPPPPRGSLTVGTFDDATDTFAGFVSFTDSAPIPPSRIRITHYPHVNVNAVRVELVFEVKHRFGRFQVTANGVTAYARPGESSVAIDVGRAHKVDWSVESDHGDSADTLYLERPPIIGMGAFKIPALPITIIYEPPQPSDSGAPRNYATYSYSKVLGSSITMGFSTEDENSESTEVTGYSRMAQAVGLMATLEATQLSGSTAAAVKKAGGLVSAALGSITETEIEGVIQGRENTVAIATRYQDDFGTAAYEGPGKGDAFVIARDVMVAWVTEDTKVFLSVLGWDAEIQVAARQLKEDLQRLEEGKRTLTDLNAESIRGLLNMDPLARFGSLALLPPDRFTRQPPIEQLTGWRKFLLEQKTSTIDINSHASYSTRITDSNSGFLGVLGFGVDEDGDVRCTTRHSSSMAVLTEEVVSASVLLNAPTAEVEVYFDNVFGTFALKQVLDVPELPDGPPIRR